MWGKWVFYGLLRDVSFDVMPGQCVGLVGRNGSGKSTALKLTTGIFRPTNGRVIIGGRVSALLELGAGFHPDLTGRENIFLNGSLLGLSKAYIESKFDDIVAFSELSDFIDMPVKHYSSGMYMRLGFSVSIHVDPEILIIDEILAVGDSLFQIKCIDRIYEMKERGVTILLVSHNLEMMRRLSTNLVWLEKGEMQAVGPTEEVAELYAASGHVAEPSSKLWLQNKDFERFGNGEVEITAVHMYDAQNQERNEFQTGQPLIVEMHYIAHRPVEDPEFGLAIHTQDGVVITSPNNRQAQMNMGTIMGEGVVRYRIDKLPLLPAKYTMTVAVHDSRMSFTYDYHKEAYPFRVMVGELKRIGGLWIFQQPGRLRIICPNRISSCYSLPVLALDATIYDPAFELLLLFSFLLLA
ncbi:MAG: ABC transporter ATP-binding protein [Chloroflexi bacterium]|nr:ABC transporter ATP-binding protein [Chloroflexota bacterium]